jgi:transcriptional regulator with XRE-family HTH domain
MARKVVSRRTATNIAQSTAFGGAVYQIRIEKDLSQEQLSLQSDIDRSYLSQLERGDKEPCLGVMFKLGNALQTTPSEILHRAEQLYASGYKTAKRQRVR